MYTLTVLVIIIDTHKISVHDVEYLLKQKIPNKSSEVVLVYWQLMIDIEQQMIKQVYINLVLFCLFPKILQKKKKKREKNERVLRIVTRTVYTKKILLPVDLLKPSSVINEVLYL